MSERRMPVRKTEIALHGDWEGWNFTVVTNPPLGAIEDLTSGELKRMISGLATILVPPWNFVDEKGEPLGDPSEATIRKLPLDLIQAVSEAYGEVGKLPPN